MSLFSGGCAHVTRREEEEGGEEEEEVGLLELLELLGLLDFDSGIIIINPFSPATISLVAISLVI
jgi:hypothetical protein